jgi:hypothetical protein
MKQSSKLTVLDAEANAFAFCAWENLTIILWATNATGPAVERLAKATWQAIDACPQGISAVHIVANGAALPTAEARAAFVQVIADVGDHLACAAVVLEGSGFWAATLRSVITGIRMLSPGKFPMKFHESIEEVPRWLPKEHFKLTGTRISAQALSNALTEARIFLDRPRPSALPAR